jgi:adenylate cyclase
MSLSETLTSPSPMAEADVPADLDLLRQIPVSDPAAVKGTAQEWLLSGEASAAGLCELLDGAMTRLVAAGLPFDRATFHVGTLHPQVLGFTASWNRAAGLCSEYRVNVHIRETTDFLLSPLRPVIDESVAIRLNPQDEYVATQYPMMTTLATEGFTDYWAFPIPHARSFHSAMTIATRARGGFRPADVEEIKRLLPALALNLDLIALERIAENVLAAYVGGRSGRRVLDGSIQRGSGEMIDAIVWVSDMRDFTGLSDRLPGADMISLLNAYFEALVRAVQAHGGEVLKFIGDGMLAIFPITADIAAARAALSALEAARQGLAAIGRLNSAEEGEALRIGGAWRPLNLGIALHRGSVFFGNIGAHDRLDFTVTGPAVNLAARVEPLAKETGRRLLLTAAVASLIETPLEPLGAFSFRGVTQPVAIFAAPEMP